MDIRSLVLVFIGFMIGMSVGVIIFRNFMVVGAFQIDNTDDPYIFRLKLDEDIKHIASRTFVVCNIDTTWRVDREKYIHNITEKDLEDTKESTHI